MIITGSLIANDPKATLANGAVNKAHVNPSLYSLVGFVLLALALVMLAMAWWRKRLYLGITMALYGISVFNLRFWGFGVPYVLAGAWYLVRAYRLNQKLKLARQEAPTMGPVGPVGPAEPLSGSRPLRANRRPVGTSARPVDSRRRSAEPGPSSHHPG